MLKRIMVAGSLVVLLWSTGSCEDSAPFDPQMAAGEWELTSVVVRSDCWPEDEGATGLEYWYMDVSASGIADVTAYDPVADECSALNLLLADNRLTGEYRFGELYPDSPYCVLNNAVDLYGTFRPSSLEFTAIRTIWPTPSYPCDPVWTFHSWPCTVRVAYTARRCTDCVSCP